MGEIEVVRVDVAAQTVGTLIRLPDRQWALFDPVEADQIIAQLDERPMVAALATCTEELGRLRKELQAAKARLAVAEHDRETRHQIEKARLCAEAEQSRLDALTLHLEVERNRLEKERLAARIEHLQQAFEKKTISALEMENEQLLLAESAHRFEVSSENLEQAQARRKEAQFRLEEYPDHKSAEVDTEIAPIDVHEAKIRELKDTIRRLTVRAPIRGFVTAIQSSPWPPSMAGIS